MSVFGDNKTIRDGFMHYLLAGVLFAAFIAGSLQFIIVFIFREQALAVFQGIGGMVFESIITWLAVALSARLMRRRRQHDSVGVALTATLCAIVVSLVAIPYLGYFSEISHVPMSYMVIKEALHICVFYTASLMYFSGFSFKHVLKRSPAHS